VRFEADVAGGRGNALLDELAEEIGVVDREEVRLVARQPVAELRAHVGHRAEHRPIALVPLEAQAQLAEGAVDGVAIGDHGSSLAPGSIKRK
jgi:hypothetical protein